MHVISMWYVGAHDTLCFQERRDCFVPYCYVFHLLVNRLSVDERGLLCCEYNNKQQCCKCYRSAVVSSWSSRFLLPSYSAKDVERVGWMYYKLMTVSRTTTCRFVPPAECPLNVSSVHCQLVPLSTYFMNIIFLFRHRPFAQFGLNDHAH